MYIDIFHLVNISNFITLLYGKVINIENMDSRLYMNEEILDLKTFKSVMNDNPSFMNFLHEKKYKLSEFNLSSRLINYWEEEGLMPSGDKYKWKIYSIIDLFVVHIFIELRKFGYPILDLKKLSGFLFPNYYPDDKFRSSDPIIEYYLFLVYAKYPMSYMVYPEGIGTAWPYNLFIENLGTLYGSHIAINMNKTLQDIFPDQAEQFIPDRGGIKLKQKEVEALFVLMSEDCDEITVKKKSGQIHSYRKKKKSESLNTESIISLLKKGGYQDIEIKVRDGKIISLNREEMLK